jgi:hypothetical protein
MSRPLVSLIPITWGRELFSASSFDCSKSRTRRPVKVNLRSGSVFAVFSACNALTMPTDIRNFFGGNPSSQSGTPSSAGKKKVDVSSFTFRIYHKTNINADSKVEGEG